MRGESICQQLRNSSFGKFHAALHDISSSLPLVQFKLPTVIVVGGRSAGKSSLLENITKCPIFPRDPGLCTKMPVKLQLIQVASESDCSVTIGWRGSVIPLKSKEDILKEVAKIMNSVDSIVTDEVIVAIWPGDALTHIPKRRCQCMMFLSMCLRTFVLMICCCLLSLDSCHCCYTSATLFLDS